MITKKLKETLQNSNKFLTLSLVITLLEKCINELLRMGITPQTVSFLQLGFEKVNKELEEGYKIIKEKEKFDNLMDKNFDEDKK